MARGVPGATLTNGSVGYIQFSADPRRKEEYLGPPNRKLPSPGSCPNPLNIRASLHGNLLQGSSLTCKSGHHAQTILELWKCRRNAVGLKQLDKHRSQMKQEFKYKNAEAERATWKWENALRQNERTRVVGSKYILKKPIRLVCNENSCLFHRRKIFSFHSSHVLHSLTTHKLWDATERAITIFLPLFWGHIVLMSQQMQHGGETDRNSYGFGLNWKLKKIYPGRRQW